MGALLPSVAIATALVVLVFRFLGRLSSPPELKPAPQDGIPPVPHLLGERLVKALPQGSVLLLHRDGELFRQSLSTYFARQERDVVQAVIVQPRTTQEVSTAIQILKQEHQRRQSSGALSDNTLFAVRGGGQSPLTGAASAKGGVLIDLTHFREVTVAEDRESVVIGAGSRWGDVSRTLDELNLGVVGGRSADVGVGGFTLGGIISQSPHRLVNVLTHSTRRNLLLHSQVRISMLKCHCIRGCAGLGGDSHGHSELPSGTLAGTEGWLQQLRHRH